MLLYQTAADGWLRSKTLVISKKEYEMKSCPWEEGWKARRNGRRQSENPYEESTRAWCLWICGFKCTIA